MNYIEENNIIRTEKEYEAALKEIERLFFIEPTMTESNNLESLISLVEQYENTHYLLPEPSFLGKIMYYLQSRSLLSKWI